MSLISVFDAPDFRHFQLYELAQNEEKRSSVRLVGLLQLVGSGHLIVGVPMSLVRGLYDSIHEPGISLPTEVDGGPVRTGIVVMTPDELEQIGGADKVTERGKQFGYYFDKLVEAPAKGWAGVSACWHMRVTSPELTALRRSYGLASKLRGDCDFSIVVACRKVGVLATNATSKVVEQQDQKLPDWTLP